MAKVPSNNQLSKELFIHDQEQTVLSDRERQIYAAIFIGLAVIAVIGGFFLWRKNLTFGFFLNQQQLAEFVKEIKTETTDLTTVSPAAVSPNQDTDHDTLSDWAEINLYRTNPYNTDTDSDGIADNLEVQQGTDPNCPQGQICTGGSGFFATSSATDVAGTLGVENDLWNRLLTGTQADSGGLSIATATALQLGQLKPNELRELLKKAGAREQDLQGLTDQQLEQAWQEFLISQQSSM